LSFLLPGALPYIQRVTGIYHPSSSPVRVFLLTAAALLLPSLLIAQSPCNLSDASGCDCLDGSNDCDLLPDMTVAQVLLEDASANPETPGELGVSVSSPNIGHGPLRIVATDYYVCGTDTVFSPGGYSGTCPDGSDPRQLIQQRIYHKNADGSMSFWDRWAGSMTYHASHGHMHVDDWGKYSLRTEVPGLDPIDWPIAAEGAKLGFCLMDYGSCLYYNGHCVDTSGNVLTSDAPNYGLGGGSYSCGLTNQGISAGYTDIYYYYLDGMQIPIPASLCNGTYKLVVVLDPYDYFLEEDESNNVVVADITLTQQGGGSLAIVADGPTSFCDGESVTLSLDGTASSYAWSNGATTPTITVSNTASISCTAVSPTCGTQTTPTVDINVTTTSPPIALGDTTCGPGSVTLTATGGGTLRWYDAPSGGTEVAVGASFVTPALSSTTTYYVASEDGTLGGNYSVGPAGHSGSSTYAGSTVNAHLVFDALSDFTLESVEVETDDAGVREIQLRNAGGSVLASTSVFIPAGVSTVPLNFNVPAGTDLELGTNGAVNLANFGGQSPELKRTSGGLSYPYEVAGVVSVKDSPYGTSYYYYFYNWTVSEPDQLCESVRVPVQAVVDSGPGCDGCNAPASPSVSAITANSATVSWVGNSGDLGYQVQGRKVGTPSFRQVQVSGTSYNVGGLKANTSYEWYVRAKCSDNSITAFTPLQSFTTTAPRLAGPVFGLEPNPAHGQFRIALEPGSVERLVQVEDLLGRVLWSATAPAGATRLSVAAPWASGMYLVRVMEGSIESTQRLVLD
jgi:hypothetical protein